MSRLEEYCKGNIDCFTSRHSLMNCIKVTDEQVKSAQKTLDMLVSRQNYLSQVEEFIANSPILLKYYAQAEDEVTRANNFSMAAIFITALDKIQDTLLECEYATKDKEELIARIHELEAKNKELQDAMDQIAKIFGVIK